MIIAQALQMLAELTTAFFGCSNVIRKQFDPVENGRELFGAIALG